MANPVNFFWSIFLKKTGDLLRKKRILQKPVILLVVQKSERFLYDPNKLWVSWKMIFPALPAPTNWSEKLVFVALFLLTFYLWNMKRTKTNMKDDI